MTKPGVAARCFALSTLDDDVALQERMERILAEMLATPRPRPGPPRDELIASMQAALPGRRS
ncbi:MAG: hypothetical protein ABI620_02590 [Chloroflexota bacterium]